MAKVRLEWVRLGALDNSGGAAVNQPFELFGAAQVVTVGASATSFSAPALTAKEEGLQGAAFARVSVLAGAVHMAWGDTPAASETTGWRIEAGGYGLAPVKAGQAISILEAADPPSAGSTSAMKAIATARSGAITAGGTAQDLMSANPDRNGWLIQNQSSANLYVRSKGSAGTSVAGADANSLIVPPGGYYEPPKITPHALSVFGAATGQAFFAEEW